MFSDILIKQAKESVVRMSSGDVKFDTIYFQDGSSSGMIVTMDTDLLMKGYIFIEETQKGRFYLGYDKKLFATV